MTLQEGSTLPVAFTTAWSSLYSHHPKLQSGQTVLCMGTGGVSLCAAQVSHTISYSLTFQLALVTGARVILTSSSQNKLDRAKALLEPLVRSRATDVIQLLDYSRIYKWDEEAKRINEGRGVDFVIEIAGRGTLARSIRSTKPAGMVAVSGRWRLGVQHSRDTGYLSDYKPIDQAILDEGECKSRMNV